MRKHALVSVLVVLLLISVAIAAAQPPPPPSPPPSLGGEDVEVFEEAEVIEQAECPPCACPPCVCPSCPPADRSGIGYAVLVTIALIVALAIAFLILRKSRKESRYKIERLTEHVKFYKEKELMDYVADCMKRGYTHNQIREHLLKKEHSKSEVDNLLKRFGF